MKNKILFSFLIFFITHFALKAQYSKYRIGVSYIFSDITTNNLNIFGKYKLNERHHLNLGIKYHFNDDSTKLLFRYYYRNFYSDNIWNKLGFTFEYRYYLIKNKIINPYAFYSFQYSRRGSKFREMFFNDFDPTKTLMERQVTFDPINLYENHIGFGLDFKLDDRLKFFIGISGGGTFFTDRHDLDDLNNGTATYGFISSRSEEFSWLFNTGLTYPIGKEKSKKKKKSK